MRTRIITIITAFMTLASIAVWADKGDGKNVPLSRKYNKSHPLVVMADWEFAPYAYRDDNGKPSGINMEIIERILDKLGVEYVVKMNSWPEVFRAFNENKAHLTIDVIDDFSGNKSYSYGNSVINYYPLSIVSRKETKAISHTEDIPDSLIVAAKTNDFATMLLHRIGHNGERIIETTPEKALEGVSNGSYDFFIWGEEPLKILMRNHHYSNLQVTHLNTRLPEMRFICHDQQLLNAINIEYSKMLEYGKITQLRNKWFNPEYKDQALSTRQILLFAALLFIAALLILLDILSYRRVKKAEKKAEDLNNLMSHSAPQNNTATVFDIKTRRLTNAVGHFIPDEGLSTEDVVDCLDRNSLRLFENDIKDFETGKIDESNHTIRWNRGTDENPDWRDLQFTSKAEKDKKGKTERIFYTAFDITDELAKRKDFQDMKWIYQQLQKSTLYGLGFYTPDGTFLSSNENMPKLFRLTHGDSAKLEDLNLYEEEVLAGFRSVNDYEQLHICHKYTPYGSDDPRYLEMRYYPVTDKNGKIIVVELSVVDMTERRKMYAEILQNEQKIKATDEKSKEYMQQLSYMIQHSKMTVWKFNDDLSRYMVSKDFYTYVEGISLDDFGKLCLDDTKDEWQKLLNVLRSESTEPVSALIHVKHNIFTTSDTWMAISCTPEMDESGKKINYFGLSRDVTELMHLEQQLKHETEMANDSGRLKGLFLANMSHEIRTPLNAIVGFSELLDSVEGEERNEFLRMIKNNCELLMRLINDILDLSEMDSNGLTMRPQETEFSQKFSDICATLKQRVTEPKVEFIEDNPYKSFRTVIDTGRISQVIINFATNAIKYTRQGHIKVGYKYSDDGLYMYCEDTGSGIPKDKKDKVFDRFFKLDDFVQGTGLGLSICKAIANACKGKIGVDSEEGKGSTFWLWIPCQAHFTEK